MKVTCKTGDSLIIASGILFAHKGKPLIIDLADIDGGGESYRLVLHFETDKEDPKARIIHQSTIGTMESVIKLINFDSVLDTGLLSPFSFAKSANSLLSLCVSVSNLPESSLKCVAYSILKDAVNKEAL